MVESRKTVPGAGLDRGRLSGILTGSELGKSMGAGESGVDWPDDGVLNTGDVSGDSSNLNA